MVKSNIGTSSETAKPVKLSGFSISKPKAKTPPAKQVGQFTKTSRRSAGLPSPPVTLRAPVQVQKIPIQALAPEQKITRAKQAWANIRVKALDRLRIDQSTRERLDELRDEYYKTPSSMKYSEYERSLKDLLGDESFVFLYNAREEFKSRVFDRAQLDIGPHLGEL